MEESEDDQESLGSLAQVIPESYWKKPDFDDTVEVLISLEWDWIPYWKLDHLLQRRGCDTTKVSLWLEQITTHLSELDVIHIRTCNRLHRLIQPHAESLQEANQAARDLQTSLKLCFLYLQRTRESIEYAKHGKPDKKKEHRRRSCGTHSTRTRCFLAHFPKLEFQCESNTESEPSSTHLFILY